ncbi:hypothetical protein [Mangrovibrevibacter kandeliae]|uniref:hypothetical protein n=1 Tax=Mangrovibrevibacter kandeliae TaxID=2968473 RepID=UPI0021188AB9|nr:hypothetical protein [Aurantimonas sp. CSK15Z-1]MCQ8781698.1 hypothetical protein [Aurantimonas sp. CSK15Z-1]
MAIDLSRTNQRLQGLARVIGPGVAPSRFILLTFDPKGPAGSQTNYVSNIDRQDAIAAMKEIIARWEGQSQQKGSA